MWLTEWTRQVEIRLYLRSCHFVGRLYVSSGRCLRPVHTIVINVWVFTCSPSRLYGRYVHVGFVGVGSAAATLSFLVYLGEYRVPLWTLQYQPSKKELLSSSFLFISIPTNLPRIAFFSAPSCHGSCAICAIHATLLLQIN